MKEINTEMLQAQRQHLASNYPTLRDQYALAALGGLTRVEITAFMGETYLEALARRSYEIADAMLKEREKLN